MAIKVLIGGKETEVWPPRDDETKERFERYDRYKLLFRAKHEEVFERLQRWMEDQGDLGITYIVCNFAGLISKIAADMLFGEIPYFVAGEEGSEEQESLIEIVKKNYLHTINYEMALSGSWRGESIYKVRFGSLFVKGKGEIPSSIIEPADPKTFFPVLDEDNVRSLRGADFAWIKRHKGKKYLRVERHSPGLIQNELYLLDGEAIISRVPLHSIEDYKEVPDSEETGFPGMLFQFVPNMRTDDEFWGISDYDGMEGIFDELNNRVSRISRVLDKHESPKLILPPGILQEDPYNPGRWYVEKEDLEAIEVNPEALGNGQANDLPRYLTWDAQLEAAFKQIDKILELGMMMSETNMDAFGLGKSGMAESGRALKFRLLRTISKINRKKLYFDQALKNILYTAQFLESIHAGGPSPEELEYRIEWQDGLPNDNYEMAQIESLRAGGSPLTSIESSIRRLDGLRGEGLEKELERIKEDESQSRGTSSVSNPELKLDPLNLEGMGLGEGAEE